MAKVSNTDIYNYDTLLDPKDFLLGTDWNNAKKTKSFRLEQIRYFVLQGLDPTNNGFLVNNGFSLVENVLTINAGWQWLLNGLLCSNEDDIEITLEYAAEGFLRIDSIYANSNGEFLVSTGTETETIAIQPAIPVNTLFAFPINIFDSNLQAGEPPVLGNTYVKKSFAKVVEFNGTGTDVVIPLNPDGFSEIRLINSALDSLSGVDLSLMVGANFEAPYQGKPYIVWNRTGGPITIKNEDYANADLPFFLKEGTDIILPDNEKILFHYDNGGLFEIFRSFSDSFELTETNFGAFSNSLQTEDELSDSDKFSFVDTSDGNKQKKTSWLNVKAKLATIYNALFVPKTLTLTIGGVTQDLSANRTFNATGKRSYFAEWKITGAMAASTNWFAQGQLDTLRGIFVATAGITPTNNFSNYSIQTPCYILPFNAKVKSYNAKGFTNGNPSATLRSIVNASYSNPIVNPQTITNALNVADVSYILGFPSQTSSFFRYQQDTGFPDIILPKGTEIRLFNFNNNLPTPLQSTIISVEFEEVL